ncbi:hypothetical protein BN1723_020850, partial [Verticillium longisporum]
EATHGLPQHVQQEVRRPLQARCHGCQQTRGTRLA